jgi:hypothetical protein
MNSTQTNSAPRLDDECEFINERHEAAVNYLSRHGLRITLCGGDNGKHPGAWIRSGWQDKVWSETEIADRFRRNPEANPGFVLGPKSNAIDCEIDSDENADEETRAAQIREGEQTLLALFEGFELPACPTFDSRRGPHRLFAWHDAFENLSFIASGKEAVVKIGRVEFRLGACGKAAQSLLPPSITHGVQRKWRRLCSLDDIAPPPIPEPVIERIIRHAIKEFEPNDRSSNAACEIDGNKPGDDFNRRGWDWAQILSPAANTWQLSRQSGSIRYWTRPGKRDGWSATTGFCDSKSGDLLYVFTDAGAPLEAKRAYSKFSAYAMLWHKGDFSAAASELTRLGFGKQTRTWTINGVELIPGCPRQTRTKLIVPIKILVNGAAVDESTVSNVESGRKEAVKRIAGHAGSGHVKAIDLFLGQILAAARQALDDPQKQDGKSVRDILIDETRPLVDFEFKTERGAYSKKREKEYTCNSFVEDFRDYGLVDKCMTAADAPPTHEAMRARLGLDLKFVWVELTKGLRTNLPDVLKDFIKTLWNKPTKFATTTVEKRDGEKEVTSEICSLIQKYRKMRWLDGNLGECQLKPGRWNTLNDTYLAWVKEDADESGIPLRDANGERIVHLAMRWELAGQLGMKLPGIVHDHHQFSNLARRHGVGEDSDRTANGSRILVLSQELTSELLENPTRIEVLG